MASWVVSGAGSSDFNGTYNESGTYGGKAAYQAASGNWLFWYLVMGWWSIDAAKGVTNAYHSETADLPGGTWIKGSGDLPAPTVVADAGHPLPPKPKPPQPPGPHGRGMYFGWIRWFAWRW